jgi:hypothetical protein
MAGSIKQENHSPGWLEQKVRKQDPIFESTRSSKKGQEF